MAKIIREVNTQTDEFDKLLFYNREILEDEDSREEERQRALAEGREQGLTEGREQGLTEGREQGLTEGREQGLTEGREQGLTEGREQSKQDIAKAMLSENCDIELISKVTNLIYDDVVKLKEEL